MTRSNRPPIGAEVWFAIEHLHYEPEHAGPLYEFMVCRGEVCAHTEGRHPGVVVRYRSMEGPMELIKFRLDGAWPIFDSSRAAALLARKLSDDYERRWGWMYAMGYEPPMRRKWEMYL